MNISIKEKILSQLINAKGEPVSGQKLADELHISRTMIWKHLKSIEEDGYVIEAIKKKGYVLQSIPDLVTPEQIIPNLNTKQLGRTIDYYTTCESTQIIAADKAREAAPHGTVVIAEEQTDGRGRLDRSWNSTANKGIWMSVIIRPAISPQFAAQFTLVSAVAITQAIQEVTNLTPEIKWPNDILINGKKVTGILTELQADMDIVHSIIIGIGVNVNQELSAFEESIQKTATSLKIENGEEIDRSLLVAKILYYLEKYGELYVENGFKPIKILWESHNCTIGKRIRATTLQEILEGVALGITNDGVLEIKLDSGEIRGVYSADIHLLGKN
ncbi:biotin--[acetyl-CoA-carboxylase] ligase [Psychrobacillus psychrodurans]|uniref:biotin--[acetyl-CoA-carboxylase] ligase n=1 Tax=Psychrobacillus psychrodurans TaxID=126157 RepID=UPI0008E07776|nr:biotin--[acetyl-CoA-carboxylase] ligase [Psychrobacillus psychrodurans]SFM50512.1 BirA family transcriptional regulator, biotin operon repressor / biotin-[acetyl-CoA-carboxylase] ligase [Psychrobacillus psychrodurans]